MSSQRYHEEEAALAYFNTVSQHRKASRSARKRGTGEGLRTYEPDHSVSKTPPPLSSSSSSSSLIISRFGGAGGGSRAALEMTLSIQ